MNNFPDQSVKYLITDYSNEPNSQRTILLFCFQNFTRETARKIKAKIGSAKVTNFYQIADLIPLLKFSFFNEFGKPFNNQVKTKWNLLNSIFMVYSDECIVHLTIFCESFSDPVARYNAINFVTNLGTVQAQKLLENWLRDLTDKFEEESLVKRISTINQTFPNLFVDLINDISISYNITQSIGLYTDKEPQSIKAAFFYASDFSKIKMLEYFFPNKYNSFISGLIPSLRNYYFDIRTFFLMNLISDNVYDNQFSGLLEEMLISDNDLDFTYVVRYSYLYEDEFTSCIFTDFKKLAKDKFRESMLIDYFIKTSADNDLMNESSKEEVIPLICETENNDNLHLLYNDDCKTINFYSPILVNNKYLMN